MRQAKELNTEYRRVFYTHDGAENGDGAIQQVAMSLGMQADDANREVGWEVHERTTQYFAVTEGSGTLVVGERGDGLGRREMRVSAAQESKWWVPPGTWHNVTVAPGEAIKLLVAYNPPHHPPGTRDRTRADAERRESAAKMSGAVCVVCGAVARYRVFMAPTYEEFAFCSPLHERQTK
jgi:mannose-6-phosphate isomerase-like protein (cupin superfamily)